MSMPPIFARDFRRTLLWIPRITLDRKSTRLNSSHITSSYAVYCFKIKISGPEQSAQRSDVVLERWKLGASGLLGREQHHHLLDRRNAGTILCGILARDRKSTRLNS